MSRSPLKNSPLQPPTGPVRFQVTIFILPVCSAFVTPKWEVEYLWARNKERCLEPGQHGAMVVPRVGAFVFHPQLEA